LHTALTRLGWRGKVGLILPSANTVTEPVFYALAPAGVSFHASRTFITGTAVEDILAMEKDKERAVRELASTQPDCLVDCCTASGIVRGLKEDQTFTAAVAKQTAVPTLSTLQLILQALEAMRITRLVMTSPYPEAMDRLESTFFQANGFTVLKARGLGLREATQLAQVPPEEIHRLCLETWDTGADGLLISCMNFNPLPIIQSLEAALGVPVVTSNTATLWGIFRALGLSDPIPGYGRLLAGPLPAPAQPSPSSRVQ
jgi:maleate isomerase